MTVHDQIINIIAAQAMRNPADIHPDSTPESLGLDSLGLVESIFAIEEAFDIAVPFNVNAPQAAEFDFSSVGSIVASVEGLLAKQAA